MSAVGFPFLAYKSRIRVVRGKKAAAGPQYRKSGKGNSLTVIDTKGFVTLVHSNWTICSLLN